MACLLNEVIEHVGNDRDTIREALRVTKPGGRVVIFAPNRYYPFETHGVYLGKKYVFGNIPLVNYLPDAAAQQARTARPRLHARPTRIDHRGAARTLG